MANLPEQFKQNMKELLQDQYNEYLESFNNARVYGLRINTNKISVNDFLKINPFNLKPIPWTDDGFYFDENDMPSKHPYYYAGLYYLQEPSAMLPAQVLPIEENDIVLDACAAPGGKSSKLANKLKGTGLLVANDISVSRAQVLLKTLESQGITNACVIAEDINNLNNLNECFDKILIDAPCSGEGMFRKEPSLIKSWIERGNEYYSSIQKSIISKALDLLKPGGKIVYSTCTFSKSEDEDIIEYALSICPELKVLPINMHDGFVSGLTENTKNCVRLYPHKINGEGHFVALLQKGNAINVNHVNENRTELPKDEFFNNINKEFENGSLVLRQDRLYFEPNTLINVKGLRVLRSGLLLGEYKHSKFEPSQALALSLKMKEYKNVLNFNLNDERVIKYLKCETLDVKDSHVNGYVLVCVDGFPLGFGKVDKGILKNKYPANYRYQ